MDAQTGAGPEPAPDSAVVEFWQRVRAHAGVAPMAEWTGPGVTGSVPPPAWAFGDSPALADELLGLVLAGRKTATATAVPELVAAGEPEPVPGELSIILDGAGRPAALLRTTKVRRARFADVDAGFAAAEGEDDGSLSAWRAGHERYWRRVLPPIGAAFSPDLEIVLEHFELVYP